MLTRTKLLEKYLKVNDCNILDILLLFVRCGKIDLYIGTWCSIWYTENNFVYKLCGTSKFYTTVPIKNKCSFVKRNFKAVLIVDFKLETSIDNLSMVRNFEVKLIFVTN